MTQSIEICKRWKIQNISCSTPSDYSHENCKNQMNETTSGAQIIAIEIRFDLERWQQWQQNTLPYAFWNWCLICFTAKPWIWHFLNSDIAYLYTICLARNIGQKNVRGWSQRLLIYSLKRGSQKFRTLIKIKRQKQRKKERTLGAVRICYFHNS